MQLALVNSVLAIAASMLGPVQSQTIVEPADGEDQPRAPPHTERRPAPGGYPGGALFVRLHQDGAPARATTRRVL